MLPPAVQRAGRGSASSEVPEPGPVYVALSYSLENPQEIVADLEQDREAAERIEAERAHFLNRWSGRAPGALHRRLRQRHLVDALVQRGWDVMRAIDVYPEKTPDSVDFERAANDIPDFVSNDEGILKAAAAWLEAGRSFRMIFWPQQGYRAWTLGDHDDIDIGAAPQVPVSGQEHVSLLADRRCQMERIHAAQRNRARSPVACSTSVSSTSPSFTRPKNTS